MACEPSWGIDFTTGLASMVAEEELLVASCWLLVEERERNSTAARFSLSVGFRPYASFHAPSTTSSGVLRSIDRSRAAIISARFSGQSPLIISSDCTTVVVRLRSAALENVSGRSNA